jgi:hypothetical protein
MKNPLAPLVCALALAAASAGYASPALAEGPATAQSLTAEQVAARIVRGNGFTWDGAKTRLRMVLIDAKGGKKERALDVIGRRHDGRLESVARFLSPSEVAGTAFLMVEKKGGASEQHVYLPGLKRTRRIVGREREGSFMGSDFTYRDLSPKEDPGAKHRLLPDEKIGNDATYVLETTPGSAKEVGYSKLVTWVRKTDFVPLRTRFFDPSGGETKTLYVKKIRDLKGKPVVVESRMQSKNGHATELIIDSLEEKDDFPDSAFSPSALER